MTGITLEQTIQINASPEKVWDTLVNPEKIKLYLYGTKADSTFEVGDSITFSGEYEGHQYLDKGEILIFNLNKHFAYTYLAQFSGLQDLPENYHIVSFEIEPQENGCKLIIEQKNIHSEEAKGHSEKGWEMVLPEIKKIAEQS
tara:strand:+ start:135 stop:563 length:429 start_codon:yes stop_codon:yes gene_type:complete